MKPESAGKKSRKLNKKGSVAAAADAVADAADDDGPQLFSSAVMASAAPAAVATPRSHVAATPAATPAPARALPAAETDGVEAKGKSASVAEMAQQVQHVAQEMAQLAQQTRSQIESQRLLLSHNSRPTAKGVSFLELKNQLLLQYNLNLVLVMLKKLEGQAPAADGAVVDRLVYLRTVLERIQPMDRKLKYQIDKLVKLAATGSVRDETDLMYKPDPSNLVPKAGAAAAEEGEEAADGIYKPPKIAATNFEEEESRAARRERREQREQKRLSSSRLLRELHDEVSDRPEEVQEEEAVGTRYLKPGKAAEKEVEERTRYEEENFTRLAAPKIKKRRNHRGVFDEVLDFAGFERLADSDVVRSNRSASMREQLAAVGSVPARKAKLRPSKRVKTGAERPDREDA